MDQTKKRLYVPGVVFVALLLVFSIPAVTVRTIHLVGYTDFKTGFYSGPPALGSIFFILIAVFFGIVALLALADRHVYTSQIEKGNCAFLRILALASAVFSIVYVVMLVLQSVGGAADPVMSVCNILFGVLAAFGMLWYAFRMGADGSRRRGAADLLLALPCVWVCIKLLTMFFDHMSVATVYENMINILRTAALCIFLLDAGKVVAGLETRNTGRWLVISGMTTSLLGLCATLPGYITSVFSFLSGGSVGASYTSAHIFVATPLDFILTLFALVFTIRYLLIREIGEEDMASYKKRRSASY